ncbi:MAG TPA: gluconate 2-dehydrogenase subunit 3 family protein [Vicinamibacteria bacterium]|nr:gluconate 2-dehydrogenase subunit 3 family protein [Vicinamibacteria bacterium]
MSGMDRRAALRLLGSASAVGFGVGAAEAATAAEQAARAVKAASRGKAYVPKFFSAHEWRTVRLLVDMIIPRDERSGSATDAGVPEFMDFLMIDPGEDDRAREWRQTAMRGGLAWIHAACRRRFGHDFVEASEAERVALLDDIAYEPDDDEADDEGPGDRPDRRVRIEHGPAFFSSFRDLTASGFWTSQMGVEDLQYQGNTFVAEWKGPPPEVLARLKLNGR